VTKHTIPQLSQKYPNKIVTIGMRAVDKPPYGRRHHSTCIHTWSSKPSYLALIVLLATVVVEFFATIKFCYLLNLNGIQEFCTF